MICWRRWCRTFFHHFAIFCWSVDFFGQGFLGLGGGSAGVGFIGKCKMTVSREILGNAVELFVAVIRPQEASMNFQRSSVVAWHLHLEICIVGNNHELSKCWAYKDSVVL